MSALLTKNIARAIYQSSKEKNDDELKDLNQKVIVWLNKKHLLSKVDKILVDLEKVINQEEGRVKVKISSSSKISEEIIKELEGFIKEKYKLKNIYLELDENQKLLGGLKITIEDKIIDATLSNKIKKLKTHLTEN